MRVRPVPCDHEGRDGAGEARDFLDGNFPADLRVALFQIARQVFAIGGRMKQCLQRITPYWRRGAMTKPRKARRAISAAIGAALTWTLWLFALNLVWEVAQLPLYTMSRYSEWPALSYALLHCTLGDTAMAFASYLIAALVTGEPRWPVRRPLIGLAVVLVAGELFTIWAEWHNVYVLRSWAYAAGMPTILGIGVAPLAQWLVLPALALTILRYRYRRLVHSKVVRQAGHCLDSPQ